ncbi:MAG: hypothetical protein KY458_09760, partial [Actinobacteria bacterium]|nr:hypothetical protein [Actinomycetota bacterium]
MAGAPAARLPAVRGLARLGGRAAEPAFLVGSAVLAGGAFFDLLGDAGVAAGDFEAPPAVAFGTRPGPPGAAARFAGATLAAPVALAALAPAALPALAALVALAAPPALAALVALAAPPALAAL